MKISKYGYSEPIVIKDANAVMVKAMDNTRTALFIARVREKSSELPDKALIDLDTAIFSKIENMIEIRDKDIIEDAHVIGEPEVELKTTVIARTNALIDILEKYKSDYFTIMFKPSGNKLTYSIKDNLSDEIIEREHELTYEARVLEGNDIGLFACDLLRRQLRLFKSLGISTIKMRYSTSKPMLITPYGKDFPRIWVAPRVEDE